MIHFHMNKIFSMLQCSLQPCVLPVHCSNDLAVNVSFLSTRPFYGSSHTAPQKLDLVSIQLSTSISACMHKCMHGLLRPLQAVQGHWQVKVIYFNQGMSHSVVDLLVRSYY